MANLNSCHFVGNVVADPEVKDFGNSKLCKLRLAVNGRKYKNQAGEEKEEVCWLDAQAWGALAGVFEQYVQKGSKLRVSGDLRTEQWDDKTDGTKRSKQVLNITDFEFLNSKQGSNSDNTNVEASQDSKPKTKAGRPRKTTANSQPQVDNNTAVDNNEDIPF